MANQLEPGSQSHGKASDGLLSGIFGGAMKAKPPSAKSIQEAPTERPSLTLFPPSLTLFPPSNEAPAPSKASGGLLSGIFGGAMKAKPPTAKSIQEAPAERVSLTLFPSSNEAPAPSKGIFNSAKTAQLASAQMTTAPPQAAAVGTPAAASLTPGPAGRVIRDVGRIMQNMTAIAGSLGGPSIDGAGGSVLPRVVGNVSKIMQDVNPFGAVSTQGTAGANPVLPGTLLPTTTATPGESKAFGGFLSRMFGGAKTAMPPSAKSMTGMMPLAPLTAGAFTAAMPQAMPNIFGGMFTTPAPSTPPPSIPPPSTPLVEVATVEATTLTPKTVYVPIPVMPARVQFRWPYHTVSQDAAP